MRNTKKRWVRLTAHIAAFMLFAACSMTVFADAEGTVIPASVKVRSGADTSSDAVASLQGNDKIQITGKTTGTDGQTWYQIVDGNVKGFIRADLIKVDGAVEGTANSEATVTQTNAEVTAASVASGTVSTGSVNVRKGPATTDAVAASAKQGTVMQISGQTTGADGKTWYQVSFNSNGSDVTGFVREDLLDTSTAASTDGEAAEGDVVEGETETEPVETEDTETTSSGYTEVSNVVSSRILPEDADLASMDIDESKLAEWESGNYYLLYTTDTKGGKYWYLYDLSSKECTKINNLSGGSEGESKSTEEGGLKSKILLIVLAALVVVLVIVVVVLLLRLRNLAWEEDYEEEADYYEDDDHEMYEEGRVNSNRWKPRNFLGSEEDEELGEEEEPIQRKSQRPVAREERAVRGEAMQGALKPRAGEAERRVRPAGAVESGRRAPEQGAHRSAEGEPRRTRSGEPVREGRPQRAEAGRTPAGNGERRRMPEATASRAPEAGARRVAGTANGSRGAQPGRPVRREADERMMERPVRGQGGSPKQAPRRQAPKPQPAYYENDNEDDEFEFEFLNMDSQDDL